MAPKFSIVTTCKGRLGNLQQSLPTFVAQAAAEVVVVDYDCPEGTGRYVAEHYPQVRVVAVADKAKFNSSHARNVGAAEATGDFLVFLDADMVIAPGFVDYLAENMKPRSYGTFGGGVANSARGGCVVERALFNTVGGYDEVIEGYGGEDLDLYTRLRFLRARHVALPREYIANVIEQDEEAREKYRGPNLRKQFLRGMTYQLAKDSIMRMTDKAKLNEEFRRNLYGAVDRQLGSVFTGEKDLELRLGIPDMVRRGYLADWEFSRTLVVKVRRKKKAETKDS
jgi:glycosyltransferase involved in cell wall biosynthesis